MKKNKSIIIATLFFIGSANFIIASMNNHIPHSKTSPEVLKKYLEAKNALEASPKILQKYLETSNALKQKTISQQ